MVNDFTLKTNSGNNQLPPDGFAKYTPLFEVGKTYVASGYRDGEKAGQIMLHGKSGFKIINFYTPFTITEEVDTLYFRSVNPSSFVMYNKVKIEEGTKVTPFIPGDIAGNIDYSLLMEHPTGEWFLDMDGMRKPVYTQTFMGTVGGGQILLGANICQLLSFFGYIETIGGSGEENMPPHFGGNYDWKYYKTKDKISIEIASSSSQIIGKRYLFVAKYVKY